MRMPSGPTEPATQPPKLLAASRATRAPARLMSRTWPARLWRARRKLLAPNVLVSMISAPGLKILVVYGANQLGLRNVELVITAVDENAFGVEQCSHGSVAKHGATQQAFPKVLTHLHENTGRWRLVASWFTPCPVASGRVLASPGYGRHFRFVIIPCSRIQEIIPYLVWSWPLEKIADPCSVADNHGGAVQLRRQ